MREPGPFQVTQEALAVVTRLLRPPLEMEGALILVLGFEQHDDRGKVEARFEREHFMVSYDSFEKFLHWPRVELCGHSIPVAPEALERLRGHTLVIQACEVGYETGGKEIREFLVAA